MDQKEEEESKTVMASELVNLRGPPAELVQTKSVVQQIVTNAGDKQREELKAILVAHQSLFNPTTNNLVHEFLHREEQEILGKFIALAFDKVDESTPEKLLEDYNKTRQLSVSKVYWQRLAARVRLDCFLLPRIDKLESQGFFDAFDAKEKAAADADSDDLGW